MEMVVCVKLPVWLVGMSLYMNLMFFAFVTLRAAARSILKSRNGSMSTLSWRSSIELVVAGDVRLESFWMSQPRSAALRM